MNIAGLNKAAVLSALYHTAAVDRSAPSYLSKFFIHPDDFRRLISKENFLFPDWIKGKHLHIDIGEDEVDTTWYNFYNGEGAAEQAIATLREQPKPPATT